MDLKGLGNVLAKIAPTLATAVGGPLAGGAVAALEGVFGIKDEGSTKDKEEALVAALSGATAEQLIALKKADQDYATKMQELGFNNIQELEKLSVSDRESARKRESDVKDLTPRILAYSITAGFFGILLFLMLSKVPAESRDILNIMLGTLGTSFVAVISYYFGSTAGSAEKTRLLASSTPPVK
jgi:hypothetical protein